MGNGQNGVVFRKAVSAIGQWSCRLCNSLAPKWVSPKQHSPTLFISPARTPDAGRGHVVGQTLTATPVLHTHREMGYRCTWIASRGGSGDTILSELHLTRESQSNEAVCDPGIYGLTLPAGWYLAIGDGSPHMDYLHEEQAAALSHAGDVLFFYTHDTVMTTRLASYQRGGLTWAITYDGLNGISDPEIEGTPPQSAPDTLRTLHSKQAAAGGRGADTDFIYGLTAEVARMLIGFRHDQTLADGEIVPIDVLAPKAGWSSQGRSRRQG